ncbi:MAG: toxic anion resistance protein [Eubacterium sp.]|nr:toxic anion resistance protein [Eubacterium sp.]
MEKELNEMNVAAPTLTFDTAAPTAPDMFAETKEPLSAAAQAQPEAKKEQDPADSLTPEELAQVEAFVPQIDIKNSSAVMNYGAGTQKKMADFSEKALDNVRTNDMGEVGQMISSLVVELKNFDADDDKGGIMGFFKKKKNQVEALKAKYSKVETNVTSIQNELEKRQVILMKDSAMLDKMYDLNLSYFKELTMYLVAGRKKLEQVRSTELAELQKKAAQSGLPEDAQAAKDLADKCDRFEKKLHDLALTRTIAMQTAPQIRMVQSSDTLMAEKIQSTIVNTIPLWKNQMVIALGVEHSTQAARAERQVTDMTNELLKKNAEALKTATIETAKESERGIVDIETLKATNASLISTLDEVMTIQKDGKAKRQAAEGELAQIESELKTKLLEASRR